MASERLLSKVDTTKAYPNIMLNRIGAGFCRSNQELYGTG